MYRPVLPTVPPPPPTVGFNAELIDALANPAGRAAFAIAKRVLERRRVAATKMEAR